MLGTAVVTVADAHLGAAPHSVTEAFLAFLEQVPDLGDALLINGDLFDFWFAYRHAIPRHGFAPECEQDQTYVKCAASPGDRDGEAGALCLFVLALGAMRIKGRRGNRGW